MISLCLGPMKILRSFFLNLKICWDSTKKSFWSIKNYSANRHQLVRLNLTKPIQANKMI